MTPDFRTHHKKSWARIFKLLRSPRIDSKEQILPGCVAWRVVTTNLLLLYLAPDSRTHHTNSWARIVKLLRSTRIDSKEPIAPGCVAWRAGTTNLFLLIDCLKIPALYMSNRMQITSRFLSTLCKWFFRVHNWSLSKNKYLNIFYILSGFLISRNWKDILQMNKLLSFLELHIFCFRTTDKKTQIGKLQFIIQKILYI